LIVDIEYKLKLVFIVWIGSHKEYDKIEPVYDPPAEQ